MQYTHENQRFCLQRKIDQKKATLVNCHSPFIVRGFHIETEGYNQDQIHMAQEMSDTWHEEQLLKALGYKRESSQAHTGPTFAYILLPEASPSPLNSKQDLVTLQISAKVSF